MLHTGIVGSIPSASTQMIIATIILATLATDTAIVLAAIAAAFASLVATCTSLVVLFKKLTRAETAALEAKAVAAEISINVDGNLKAQIERADRLTHAMADLAKQGMEVATFSPPPTHLESSPDRSGTSLEN